MPSLAVVAALLAGLAAAAPAGVPVKAAFDCAPWDGPALRLSIAIPDERIELTIWGRGWERLQKGARSLTIDNAGSPESTGRGRVCSTMAPKMSCRPEALTLRLDKAQLQPGGRLKGRVRVPGGSWVPFEGTIDPARPLCG